MGKQEKRKIFVWNTLWKEAAQEPEMKVGNENNEGHSEVIGTIGYTV